jgi:hypothetical protein
VKVAVVMPGHIGTDIVHNSRKILGGPAPEDMSADEVAVMRANMVKRGMPLDGVSDDDLRTFMGNMADMFRDNAPTSAAQAATIILEGVHDDRWRLLIGDDAERLDEAVRADPVKAYSHEGPGLSTILGGGG